MTTKLIPQGLKILLFIIMTKSSAMAGGSNYDPNPDQSATSNQAVLILTVDDSGYAGDNTICDNTTVLQVQSRVKDNVTKFIMNKTEELQVKCLKVFTKHHAAFCKTHTSSHKQGSDWAEYFYTAGLYCAQRPIDEQALVSLSINCSKHPAEECFKIMQDPINSQKIKSIRPTTFHF